VPSPLKKTSPPSKNFISTKTRLENVKTGYFFGDPETNRPEDLGDGQQGGNGQLSRRHLQIRQEAATRHPGGQAVGQRVRDSAT
jgi:hypothetical protein